MKVVIHKKENQVIAEVKSDEIIIARVEDALDLMADPDLENSSKIIIRKENIAPDFFDLRTGIAGEILQKLINYRIQLAVVGDFENIESKSFKAFMIEENRGHNLFFVSDVDAAQNMLVTR